MITTSERYSHGLHPDTNILIGTGEIICIKDLTTNDHVVGSDGLCRPVLSIESSFSNMYRIIPSKGNPFICSNTFMLTLKGTKPFITTANSNTNKKFSVKYSQQGNIKRTSFATDVEAQNFLNTLPEDICEISVYDYLLKNPDFKHRTFLYHPILNFTHQEVPFDPWIIGFWLGDGDSNGTGITTNDPPVVVCLNQKLPQYGLQLTKTSGKCRYNICGADENFGQKGRNHMINVLNGLNMKNNKHIPDLYKLNSFEVRLGVLAGLIDSDGYRDVKGNYIEIMQLSDKLSDGIRYIASSLGFMVTHRKCMKSCPSNGEMSEGIYNRIMIFGDGMEHIPVILERKKCLPRGISKRATCQNFTIEHVGLGPYCGFDISGDGRFLMGDFTVANCK